MHNRAIKIALSLLVGFILLTAGILAGFAVGYYAGTQDEQRVCVQYINEHNTVNHLAVWRR